jgi:hypothetical protein
VEAGHFVDPDSGPNAGGTTTRMPDFGFNTRYEKAGFGHVQSSSYSEIWAQEGWGPTTVSLAGAEPGRRS